MADIERVTVTLNTGLLRDIDRWEKNRSRFVAEAVRRELERRERDELRKSLDNPHPESVELAEQGLEEWTCGSFANAPLECRGASRTAGRWGHAPNAERGTGNGGGYGRSWVFGDGVRRHAVRSGHQIHRPGPVRRVRPD